MSRLVRLAAMPVTIMMLGAGPLHAEEPPFPATFDEAYTGQLVIDLFPVDGGSRLRRDRGEAELSFARQPDGTVKFSAKGNADDSGGFEMSVVLTVAEDGIWRSLSPEGMVQLDGNGRFLSISYIDGFELIWTGEIGMEEGSLTFRRIPTAAAPDAEREVAATFSLDVERPRTGPQPDTVGDEAAEAAGDGGCARIEWRLVNRWTWGGGLSLDREPHCVQ